MRLLLGKVWDKWASHILLHSGNVPGLRIFSGEFSTYRKYYTISPEKLSLCFQRPEACSVETDLSTIPHQYADRCSLANGTFCVRDSGPVFLVNSRRDTLMSSADSPQWSKVAAVLLTVGHPDVVRQRGRMCTPVLVLCCLDNDLQHLPLVGLMAPEVPPTPQSSLVCAFHMAPGGTEPHRLPVFCPDLLVYSCSRTSLLSVHVHNHPVWFKLMMDRAGFKPVNQQLDLPLMTHFSRFSRQWHQTLAINLLL